MAYHCLFYITSVLWNPLMIEVTDPQDLIITLTHRVGIEVKLFANLPISNKSPSYLCSNKNWDVKNTCIVDIAKNAASLI